MSFKTTWPDVYATPMDVRMFSSLLKTSIVKLAEEETEKLIVADRELMQYLLQASSIVKSYLSKRFGTAFTTTPYFSPSIPNRDNAKPIYAWGLTGITVGGGATTEQWQLKFNTSTAFTLSGLITGSDGNGTTDADFTSDSGDVVIASTFWDISNQIPAPEDILYFSTYKHHGAVVTLTAKLACAYCLKAIASSVDVDGMKSAESMEDEVMEMLKNLADSKKGLSLTGGDDSVDLNILQHYNVSLLGEDTTDYETESGTGATLIDDWDGDYT